MFYLFIPSSEQFNNEVSSDVIMRHSLNWFFRWSDRSRNTKLVLLVANLPQIVGCLMYFVGLSPWMLVAGRFVAGM